MENQRRWIAYDWFKLVVAVILLILFIILLLQSAPPIASSEMAMPPYPPVDFSWTYDPTSRALFNPQGEKLYELSADGKSWLPVSTSGLAVQTQSAAKPPASTPIPTVSPVPTETAVSTVAVLENPTPMPTPEAPQPEPTTVVEPTPTQVQPTADVSCQPAAPARLVVGQNARVASNLNLRSSPEIGSNLMRVNPVGTELKVLEGPQCVAHQGSAYLWWKVESPDGTQGWSAEATLNGSAYFLAPIP